MKRLRRRYGHATRRTGVRVEKVHPFRGNAVATRVTLEDGWRMTFIGPMSKSKAIRQAEWHRSRGERSEA
jgi:hypothetical protein